MSKNNVKQGTSPTRGDLTSDDLEELLKFPYHQYVNKQEEESDVEALRNFVLTNGEYEANNIDEICKNAEYDYNCKEMEKIASCRALNKELQYSVNRLLSKVQSTLDKKRNDKIAVKEFLEGLDYKHKSNNFKKGNSSKPVSLFASPYFRDIRGMAPPENEDTIKKRENHDITAYVQPPRAWMLFEKHLLINAVYSNCLSYILKPHKTKRNYLRDKLKGDLKNLTEAQETSLKKQVKEIEKEISIQCQKHRREIIEEAKDHIKWHEIALDGYRNGEECEIMWNNYMSIFIKKDAFTEAEDKKLKHLVEKYNGRNWDAIAEELQTGRSAIQCFERYQRHLNPVMHKKYWTPEEDAKLAHLVESNRIGDFIPWNIVCSQMEGRERHQVINRFERTINNRLKRTPWSKEEDAMLLMCVKKFNCHWIRMKEYLPGRNAYTIRERYVNILDPYIKHGPWSKEEDRKLIALIQKYGHGKWSRISKEMKGRTDNMCLIRASTLGLKRGEKIDMNAYVKDEIIDEYESGEGFYAPRRRPTRISMRADIQREALETLKSALMRIAPAAVDATKGTINVPCISAALMRNLHKELFKNEQNKTLKCWKPRYLSVDGISKIDFAKRKRYIKKNGRIDEDNESEEEEERENLPGSDSERVSNHTEISEILKSQFHEIGNLIKLPKSMNRINLSSRRSAEVAILRTFYQQKLMCSNVSVDEEDFIFCGNNYNLSLADIIYHFVQPPATLNDSAILLPPNSTTLDGMDIMKVAQNRLNRTGKLINQSKHYIRYLIKRTSAPKCIKCCVAENTEACCQKIDINDMKKNLFIPTESMTKSAMVENGESSVQAENCCCEELADSRTEVDLLTKRFLSLFMWPYLLSRKQLQTEQEELMIRKKLPMGAPRKHPNAKRIYRKTAVKKEPNEESTVLPKGKRKRLGSTHSRRKVFVKQNHKSEHSSEETPVVTSLPSLQTPLRRSLRLATSREPSYTFNDNSGEESS